MYEHLRQDIEKLDKSLKSAPKEEKEGIKQLHKEKLRDLQKKKREESVRKSHRSKEEKQ